MLGYFVMQTQGLTYDNGGRLPEQTKHLHPLPPLVPEVGLASPKRYACIISALV